MKKAWNTLVRPLKNFRYQKKAMNYAEKIASGEITEAAPKHKEDLAFFEKVQKDENIKKDLASKHEKLVDNMYKIKITSDEVKENYPTERQLPTKETEWLHRNDPVSEYGFYEPPTEKIPKGKLIFREAMEVLRAQQELFGDPDIPRTKIEESKKLLEQHPALKRVGEEQIKRMWQYFRPFERFNTQEVHRISDLKRVQDLLFNEEEIIDVISDLKNGFAKHLQNYPEQRDAYEQLDEDEKTEFLKEVMHSRAKEAKRLEERLKEVGPPVVESAEVKSEEKTEVEEKDGSMKRNE